MLRHLITALICLMSITQADIVTIWAKGVNADGGWRDFDKKFDGSDDEQCWAITAGNLIDWWQTQNADKLPANTPQGRAVVQAFMQSFTNAGSDPDEGIRWWFTGEYSPGHSDCAARREGAAGAYLKSVFPTTSAPPVTLLTTLREPQTTADLTAATLINGAKCGAAFWIGVSYKSPSGRAAQHSLNVWGVTYDESDPTSSHICGIWIADSDDRKIGLTYVPLKEDKGMLIFNSPDHPIYGRMPRIVIDTISTLKPSISDHSISD